MLLPIWLSEDWLTQRLSRNVDDVWEVKFCLVLLPFYPHKLQNDLPFDLPHLSVHLSHRLGDPQNVRCETWRAYQCMLHDLVKKKKKTEYCILQSHIKSCIFLLYTSLCVCRSPYLWNICMYIPEKALLELRT